MCVQYMEPFQYYDITYKKIFLKEIRRVYRTVVVLKEMSKTCQ
jgi:hypothetical protein